MGTHPIFESDFDCLTDAYRKEQMIESIILQAALASSLIGFSGIVPFLFANQVNVAPDSRWMKLLLAFGAGSLLGDAFLHLLPEVIGSSHWPFGVLVGYLFGVIVQKMNLFSEDVKVQGAYINLMANCLDNFTHGLAIGGSFLIDAQSGWSTTACILIHEIPHEFADFAILMRGLKFKEALPLQIGTALTGISGAMSVIYLRDLSEGILMLVVPFTIGAFIYIALSNILPELIEEGEYLPEIFVSLVLGIAAMGCFGHGFNMAGSIVFVVFLLLDTGAIGLGQGLTVKRD